MSRSSFYCFPSCKGQKTSPEKLRTCVIIFIFSVRYCRHARFLSFFKNIGNSLARKAVAVGICMHEPLCIVCALILKKKFKVLHRSRPRWCRQALRVPAAIPSGRSVVSRITSTGFPSGRSLLLYSSGIREDHIASRKEVVEIKHVERLDYADALVIRRARSRRPYAPRDSYVSDR